jgi:hypothetical protein
MIQGSWGLSATEHFAFFFAVFVFVFVFFVFRRDDDDGELIGALRRRVPPTRGSSPRMP